MNLMSWCNADTADYNVQSGWWFVVLGCVVSLLPVGAAALIRHNFATSRNALTVGAALAAMTVVSTLLMKWIVRGGWPLIAGGLALAAMIMGAALVLHGQPNAARQLTSGMGSAGFFVFLLGTIPRGKSPGYVMAAAFWLALALVAMVILV